MRDSVLAETNNRQEPFTYGSLPGREIYLVPPTEVAEVTPVPAPVAPVAPAPVVGTPEEEFAWGLIGESTDAVQLQKFIRTFPQGVHVDEAFARLDELRQVTITAKPQPEPVTEVAALTAPETITVAPIVPAEPVTPPVTEVAVVTEPVVTPEPVPEPVVDNTELIISLQKELRRAGCNPGPADGIWGPRSQRAVRSFSRDGDIAIASTDPSEGLLEILKSKDGVVCVQAPPPTTTPKKRTTTANTTVAAPKPTQAAPAPAPEPEPQVTVTIENDSDDCSAGIFIFGMMGC